MTDSPRRQKLEGSLRAALDRYGRPSVIGNVPMTTPEFANWPWKGEAGATCIDYAYFAVEYAIKALAEEAQADPELAFCPARDWSPYAAGRAHLGAVTAIRALVFAWYTTDKAVDGVSYQDMGRSSKFVDGSYRSLFVARNYLRLYARTKGSPHLAAAIVALRRALNTIDTTTSYYSFLDEKEIVTGQLKEGRAPTLSKEQLAAFAGDHWAIVPIIRAGAVGRPPFPDEVYAGLAVDKVGPPSVEDVMRVHAVAAAKAEPVGEPADDEEA